MKCAKVLSLRVTLVCKSCMIVLALCSLISAIGAEEEQPRAFREVVVGHHLLVHVLVQDAQEVHHKCLQ